MIFSILRKKLNKVMRTFINLDPPQILIFGFIMIILIGAFLLDLPISSKDGNSVGLLNAFFTSTSAVCVTGLVVVDTATHWTSFGQIVIIALIQIGGLGFMTMTTMFFILSGKKITIKERVLIQSSLNYNSLSGVVRFSKHVLVFTFLVEGIGSLLLCLRFIPIYGFVKGIGMSIFHAITAFCNAGFDLIGEFGSFTPYVDDWIINLTLMILIITGGLGFSVVMDIKEKRKLNRISIHSKLVLTMTVGLIFFGAFVIYVLENNNPATLKELPFQVKILSSFFQSVTARTAGFNTLDFTQLTSASQFFTIILMFIGGAPGSTAGGVKITTIGILIVAVISVLRGQKDTEIFKRRVAIDIIRKALAIIIIGFFIVIIITMILATTEQATFMEILFEVVSAFGTTGLSLGITSELSIVGKIAIMFTMFIGRLGPLTIGFAITRRQLQYDKRNYRYPKGNIMVG